MNDGSLHKLVVAVKRTKDEEVQWHALGGLWEALLLRASRHAAWKGRGLGAYERDKLEGQLIDRAVKAVDSFDPDLGVPFEAWLRKLWRQELISFLRSRPKDYKGEFAKQVSLASSDGEGVFDPVDDRGQSPENIAANDDVASFLHTSINHTIAGFDDSQDALDAWFIGTGDAFSRRTLFEHHAQGTLMAIESPVMTTISGFEIYARRRFWKNLGT